MDAEKASFSREYFGRLVLASLRENPDRQGIAEAAGPFFVIPFTHGPAFPYHYFMFVKFLTRRDVNAIPACSHEQDST